MLALGGISRNLPPLSGQCGQFVLFLTLTRSSGSLLVKKVRATILGCFVVSLTYWLTDESSLYKHSSRSSAWKMIGSDELVQSAAILRRYTERIFTVRFFLTTFRLPTSLSSVLEYILVSIRCAGRIAAAAGVVVASARGGALLRAQTILGAAAVVSPVCWYPPPLLALAFITFFFF